MKDPFFGIPLEDLVGLPPPPKLISPFSNAGGSFKFSDLKALLRTRKNGSAPGINQIPYKVYKCCEGLAHYLCVKFSGNPGAMAL